MDIRLKGDRCTLPEFIKNREIKQALISIPEVYDDKTYIKNYSSFKLDTILNDVILGVINYTYNEDTPVYSHAYSNDLICMDYTTKTIIGYLADCSKKIIKKDLPNYKICKCTALQVEIKSKFNNKLYSILISMLPDILKITEYRNLYITLEVNYTETVENDYIDGKNSYDFDVEFPNSNLLELENILDLINYIRNPGIIDLIVKNYVDGEVKEHISQREVSTYMPIGAMISTVIKSNLLEKIKSNPSNRAILLKSIKDAISTAGKTVTLDTKSADNVTVENNIYNYNEFKTVKGWEFIEIRDVNRIKFNGKVLLDLNNLNTTV